MTLIMISKSPFDWEPLKNRLLDGSPAEQEAGRAINNMLYAGSHVLAASESIARVIADASKPRRARAPKDPSGYAVRLSDEDWNDVLDALRRLAGPGNNHAQTHNRIRDILEQNEGFKRT